MQLRTFSQSNAVTLGLAMGLTLCLSLTACSVSASKSEPERQENTATAQEQSTENLDAQASSIVAEMTVEEKVAQLFFVTPEALTSTGHVVIAGETTKNSYNAMPVGGLIYREVNLIDPEQTRTMLNATQEYATERTGIPVFLGVDEEGGTVKRVGGRSSFGVADPGDMRSIGDTGDTAQAREVARTIGTYLANLGFNVDFAPVADIANTNSTTMSQRSFGATSQTVSPMVVAQIEGFGDAKMLCSAKHFPGIGGAYGDSHTDAIATSKTIDEMKAEELLPFYAAIEADVPFIMVGHLTVQQATGSQLPASLNSVIMSELLRRDMGYDGLIITDALNMGAVTRFYDDNEVGLQAILAGADMILMPVNLDASYNAVLVAVHDGRLSQERLDESVARIVRTKLEMKQ